MGRARRYARCSRPAAMSLRRFSILAASLPFTLSVFACSNAESDDDIQGLESNYTSDAGAPQSGDASAPNAADAADTPVDVPAFTLADVASTPKLRFSHAGATPVDAAQTKWTTAVAGTDRRFELVGAIPVAQSKLLVLVQFGRGAAPIEKTTYDCATKQAVVMVSTPDGKKSFTAIDGAPQRVCRVVIDDLRVVQPTNAVLAKPYHEVVGHVEAQVGPREDGHAQATELRATFAARVFEQ